MLPRDKRVSSSLVTLIMKKGRGFTTPHLSLKLLPLDTAQSSRFSVVVAKKIASKAVIRNTFRRRIFALIGEFYGRIPSSYAALVFVRVSIDEMSPVELRQEVKELLAKAFLVEL